MGPDITVFLGEPLENQDGGGHSQEGGISTSLCDLRGFTVFKTVCQVTPSHREGVHLRQCPALLYMCVNVRDQEPGLPVCSMKQDLREERCFEETTQDCEGSSSSPRTPMGSECLELSPEFRGARLAYPNSCPVTHTLYN